MKTQTVEKIKNAKDTSTKFLYGIGLGGVAIGLWWVIKIILCATTGICLIF